MISFIFSKALSLFYVFVMFGAVNATERKHSCSFESALFDDFLDMMIKIKQDRSSDVGSTKPILSGKPTVAFTASMTKTVDVPVNHNVIFDRVWTNTLSVYDSNTGIFTAPVNGLYHLSCTIMSDGQKTVRVHLYKNNSPTVIAGYTGRGHDSGALNTILHLQKGDQISIRRSTYNHGTLYNDSHSNFNMFSGFLIA